MKNSYILIPLVILMTSFAYGQTYFSGGIYSNTTWSKSNSPYIIDGDIVIFPGFTLTIEPGVEVKFDGYYEIESRGSISAIGTLNDSIIFTSNNQNPNKADWKSVRHSQNDDPGLFQYCKFEYSDNGLWGWGKWDSQGNYVKNSLFQHNNYGITHNNNKAFEILDNVFLNNTYGFYGDFSSGGYASNCYFKGNNIGFEAGGVFIDKCIFEYNGLALRQGMVAPDGEITNSQFFYNDTAIFAGGPLISNNEIKNNNTGIVTQHSSETFNGIEYYVPIYDNDICNNLDYNIINGHNENMNIAQNCFCNSDSTEIERKLLDGYDDITKGLFNYTIYDPNCNTIISTVYKVGNPPTSVVNLSNFYYNISLYPNPFINKIHIDSDENNYFVTITSLNGKILYSDHCPTGNNELVLDNLSAGVYYIQLQNSHTNITKKLIKN